MFDKGLKTKVEYLKSVDGYTSGSRGAALHLDRNRKKLPLAPLPPCTEAQISCVTQSRLSVLAKTENDLENTSKAYLQDESKSFAEHDQGLVPLIRAYRRILAEKVLRSGCTSETIRTFVSLRAIYTRTGQLAAAQALRCQFEKLFRDESALAWPNTKDLDLFHLAAISGSPDSLQFLVDTGSSVNAPFTNEASSFNQYTALHCAVYAANTLAIDWLLHNGADVAAKTAEGQTSLHMAISNKLESSIAYEVVRLLITDAPEKAPFLNAQDNTGMTALDLAMEAGLDEIVQLLMQHGARENSRKEVRSMTTP